MKGTFHFIVLLLLCRCVNGQGFTEKLSNAIANLEADSQMKSALLGIYVTDQRSGAVIFGKNETIGLQAASTQKVITSVAAFELLGAGYRYKTNLAYSGKIDNGILNGDLYLDGHGDPTLGSWRFDNTKEQVVLNKWIQAIKKAGIKQVNSVFVLNNNWETQTIPGGWIWDDIGNYYGAGVAALNWRENQYDLKLRSGSKTGDPVTIVSTEPKVYHVTLTSELTTGKPGSGDNGYIYLPPYSSAGFVRGTIPPNQDAFTISGSFPDPGTEMKAIFENELARQGVQMRLDTVVNKKAATLPEMTVLLTHLSPPLDSINYWFLKKSINLYGEALVKTLGNEKRKEASTEAGLKVVKEFWKNNGVEAAAINISDGSGLSPQNRITAQALVSVMQYARLRPWFSSFYNSLPEMNGIKMKSGSIGGVKSFTGYAGHYTFAFIVNNFNGPSSDMVGKMYKVLDLLK